MTNSGKVAFPPKCGSRKHVNGAKSAMLALDANLGRTAQSEKSLKLKRRFCRLPIHRMCYDRSLTTRDRSDDTALENIKKAIAPKKAAWRLLRLCDGTVGTGAQRDCLGM